MGWLSFGRMASRLRFARLIWGHAQDGVARAALDGVRVVLVSPQQAGNVGSVCRVATNFGGRKIFAWRLVLVIIECNELWLVDPQCDVKGAEAQTMAANVASRAKLERVHVADTLSQALKDCSMAIGFTRRSGGLRLPDIQLSDLHIPSLDSLNLVLVFGREDRGLTNAELLQCTHVCSIPSSPGAGSLNLSHAVAVALSRLYEKVPQEQGLDRATYLPPQSTSFKSLPGTASVGEVENLMRRWELVLQACNQVTLMLGIPNYRMQERLLVHVRRMLLRTGPSIRELGFLHGFLTMVETVASRTMTSQKDEKAVLALPTLVSFAVISELLIHTPLRHPLASSSLPFVKAAMSLQEPSSSPETSQVLSLCSSAPSSDKSSSSTLVATWE